MNLRQRNSILEMFGYERQKRSRVADYMIVSEGFQHIFLTKPNKNSHLL